MASSGEPKPPVGEETLEPENDTVAQPKESVVTAEEVREYPGGSFDGDVPHSSRAEGGVEGEPEKTLALADELFDKGSKAIEENDLVEAVDCLGRALEIRVAHYGELAPECATSYYKYGCALLYKAQEEADALGNVPKASKRSSSTDAVGRTGDEGPISKASASKEGEGPTSTQDQEECNGGSEDDDEELPEADEDESDLDLSWKLLDIARAIEEKRQEVTMERVKILSALGEVSLEREDFETSLNDYRNALSFLENLVEPDHRRVVELNFRICLVLEVASKIEEAIPYCEKAIMLCKSHMQRLKEDIMNMKGSKSAMEDVDVASSFSNEDVRQPTDALISGKEEEIQVVSEFQCELEKKLEDMRQAMSNPKSMFSEFLKMASAKFAPGDKQSTKVEPTSLSLNTTQNGGGHSNFHPSTVPAAANNGPVTHLGVVGRGVKRASVVPITTEATAKRTSLDLSEENSDKSASEVLTSAFQDTERHTK